MLDGVWLNRYIHINNVDDPAASKIKTKEKAVNVNGDKPSREFADKNRQSSLKVKEICLFWNALQRVEKFVAFIALYPELMQSA